MDLAYLPLVLLALILALIALAALRQKVKRKGPGSPGHGGY
jgi:hypothetical protein